MFLQRFYLNGTFGSSAYYRYLAAVALPQYRKAVWRSRSAEAKVFAANLVKAQEEYRLITGDYTIDFSALDIDL